MRVHPPWLQHSFVSAPKISISANILHVFIYGYTATNLLFPRHKAYKGKQRKRDTKDTDISRCSQIKKTCAY